MEGGNEGALSFMLIHVIEVNFWEGDPFNHVCTFIIYYMAKDNKANSLKIESRECIQEIKGWRCRFPYIVSFGLWEKFTLTEWIFKEEWNK